ncbi:hypothetical protein BU23DRAFT_572297 [Bimuria novae-zelandiae CBS 107.79]|uniref:C3H1-type domain-containing protein n=1 Tax=Bimuria novae-zelandiae CBS 107.79 TaxID=1447943 RepID=A0A6A5UX67_9PLEO|nr:hypothetical protein BU23DRAFT_572297 [Bimuria novae-zelandiae CBS 107.79]
MPTGQRGRKADLFAFRGPGDEFELPSPASKPSSLFEGFRAPIRAYTTPTSSVIEATVPLPGPFARSLGRNTRAAAGRADQLEVLREHAIAEYQVKEETRAPAKSVPPHLRKAVAQTTKATAKSIPPHLRRAVAQNPNANELSQNTTPPATSPNTAEPTAPTAPTAVTVIAPPKVASTPLRLKLPRGVESYVHMKPPSQAQGLHGRATYSYIIAKPSTAKDRPELPGGEKLPPTWSRCPDDADFGLCAYAWATMAPCPYGGDCLLRHEPFTDEEETYLDERAPRLRRMLLKQCWAAPSPPILETKFVK